MLQNLQSVKQSVIIRDRVLSLTVEMIRRLHAFVSALPQFEGEVLLKLEAPAQFYTATAIANSIMAKLGGELSKAQDPRFDKTRRALRKKIPKGPRGVPKAKPATEPVPNEATA
jgi:hypothetical protein